MKKRSTKVSNIDYDLLLQIVDNTFGNIFVTDASGKVIFANDNTVRSFGIPREEIIGSTAQELVAKGVISKSTSLEAIEKKDIVIGALTTQTGYQLLNFSKPLFDEYGDVKIVMTFGQQESLMQQVMEEIENEKRKTQAYKEALIRIGGLISKDSELIVESASMKSLFTKIDKVARTDSIILLYGESGVGKDVVANYIHHGSDRANEPFVPVNCAAIPRELMESEFFGYEKGAFTGAQQKGKAGLFELADKGTLFLDEIGEMPLEIQAKFLRVIETGIVTRVGGEKQIKTNVRLITATNRNLSMMILENRFREDLYFRLNVISFRIPPLRERREEIPIFAQHFLDSYNRKYVQNKYLSPNAMEELKNYTWKGNVRELRNVIERLVLTSDDDELNVNNALDLNTPTEKNDEIKDKKNISVKDLYKEKERKKVLDTLLTVNGNKTKAAEILGISKGKLYKLLDE